jgi:hypothetical protein
MRLLHSFPIGLLLLLTALPALRAQDDGRQSRGRRAGGNWIRQGDQNPAQPAEGDTKSKSLSFSTKSGSARSVSGFGAEKRRGLVAGFGAPKKATAEKTVSSSAPGEEKSPQNANPSSPSPENRLADMIRQQAKSLLAQYDENRNGKLEREEWSKMHRRHWAADLNHDGEITLDELTAHLSNLNNVRPPNVVRGERPGAASPSSAGPATSFRKSYQIRSATERLPEGLPEWFARKDADGDGQVAMAEYASSWDDAKAREFRRLDRDNDGIITPEECLKAEK